MPQKKVSVKNIDADLFGLGNEPSMNDLEKMFSKAEFKSIIKNDFDGNSDLVTKQYLKRRIQQRRIEKDQNIDTTKLNNEIITENDFKISMLYKGAKLSESNAEYGSRLGLERNFLNPNEYLLTTSQIGKIARKKQPKPYSPYLEEIETTGYVEPNIVIDDVGGDIRGAIKASSTLGTRQQFVEAGLIAPLKSEINQARLKEQFMIKARAKAKKLGISEAFIKMDNIGISPDGLSLDATIVIQRNALGFVRSAKNDKAEQGVYKFIALPFTLYYKKKLQLQSEFRRIANLTDLTADQIEIAMSSDSNPEKDKYLKKISDKIRSIHKTHPSKGKDVDRKKIEQLDPNLKSYVDITPKSELITLDVD